MKILKLSIPILFLCIISISCKKNTDIVVPTVAKGQGYIQLDCENCLIGYGMPDQYKSFSNAGGLSPKYPYNYSEGYSLMAYITALDKEQKLTLSVYDDDAKLVYKSNTTQGTTGRWEVQVYLSKK